jgi:hypothetical protein
MTAHPGNIVMNDFRGAMKRDVSQACALCCWKST